MKLPTVDDDREPLQVNQSRSQSPVYDRAMIGSASGDWDMLNL